MRISDWSSDVCSSDLKPTETVGDPACGTGGFLVGVARYLWETYTSPEGIHVDAETGQKIYTGDRLEPHLDHIRQSMFHGFDFDTTMPRIAALNLLLHGIDAPDIHYQARSEERRVGKESVSTCRYRWEPHTTKKKKQHN